MGDHRRSGHRKNTEHSLAGSLFRGFAVMIPIALLLLLLLTAIAFRSADPSRILMPLSAVALVAIAFLVGFASARFYKKNGLFVGILCGAALAVLSFGSALALSHGSALTPARWLSYPAILLLSSLGGIFGGAHRVKPRRRH